MNESEGHCTSGTALIYMSEQQYDEEEISPDISASDTRRKSVENLLVSSHEVIGNSISAALAMTLPASCPLGQSQNGSLEPRFSSSSPGASPSSSPRPSPRQHHRREASRSEGSGSHSSVKDSTNLLDKPDSLEDSISRSSDSSQLADLNRSGGHDSSKERKDSSRHSNVAKKKSSWYSALYPTYKSRSEDFKRIFKDVPGEERLVVDYSCALQKDILVHGRLYVSQNYLCFYANIFRWETQVSLRWKDVTSITKEKTALVIPNAILVCTLSEKHFLTSFGARDKTYLMLFRVWQNALMDQQMSAQEMWQWVHSCYGDELGLTSDDEDYIPPVVEVDKLVNLGGVQLSDSFSEDCYSLAESHMGDVGLSAVLPPLGVNVLHRAVLADSSKLELHPLDSFLPTDMSDTSESDSERPPGKGEVTCTSPHEGRKICHAVIPMHIDQLFTLVFTSSKFYVDFHTGRDTADIVQSLWTENASTGLKERMCTLTLALTGAVGPKSTQVTEKQTMLSCSKPGWLYAIDTESSNAGIPYADSFYITSHYCITRTGENESLMTVYAQIKYKKSVWGLVKSFIEKNTWNGFADFYDSLVKALLEESASTVAGIKKKVRRRRKGMTAAATPPEEVPQRLGRPLIRRGVAESDGRGSTDMLVWAVVITLILLVGLNVFLYYKLWALEAWSLKSGLDIDTMEALKNPPASHEEWLHLLQKQEMLHKAELQKWQQVLESAVELLRKTEKSLNDLQVSINPTSDKKVLSILKEFVEGAAANRNAGEL